MPIKKKRPMSKEDLEKYALERGATLTSSSGEKYNSSGEKLKVQSAPNKRAPKPEKEDEEEYKIIADALKYAADQSAQILKDIRDQINLQRLESAQPPVEWVFDVVRDKDGFIKTIKASAPKKKQAYN